MKETRLLDSTYLNQVHTLLKFTNKTVAFANYFLCDSETDYECYGIFIDTHLDSVISIINNKEIPAYTVSRWHSIYNSAETLIDVIRLKEPNLKQFFTLTADLELADMQKSLHRYQPYVEHVVAAGALTGYENIDHDVLSYTRSTNAMTVYLWVLKNEYRTI